MALKVFCFQASVFGDTGKHLGANFIGIVKGPSEFAPDIVG